VVSPGSIPNDEILVEDSGTVRIVRINRPARRNSLSTPTLTRLEAIVDELASRSDISALIITGTGNVFASGADLNELRTLTPETARQFAKRGQRIFQKFDDLGQLTIAAINGYCYGGALDLALACKVRVASSNAEFCHPGARLGIITGWGGTQRLPRLVGAGHALEMLFTTEPIGSEEALRVGLVSCVEDPVIDCALKLAFEAHHA
jgi:enoyl-CoA hydratase/carnithine racemase